MRILQLVSSLGIGGAERFVTDLSLKLNEVSGVEVRLLVLDNAEHVGKSKVYEKSLIDELSNLGVQVFIAPKRGRKNILSTFAFLRSHINTFRPDIVHSHLLIWSLLVSFIKNRDIKHIYTQHINRLRYPLIHKFYLNKIIDKYISICDEATSDFKKSISEDKICKIVNGIDLNKFNTFKRQNTQRDNDIFKMIMVSRLEPQKNHEMTIRVLKKLKDIRPQLKFSLSIVGEGSLSKQLKVLVDDLNINDKISFLGTREDVSDLLSKHHLFLLSSDFEGFSIALIEALASKINILATNVGGNDEILGYGKFGYLIDKNDYDAYLKMLLYIIDNELLYDTDTDTDTDADLYKHLFNLSIESSALNHINLYKKTCNL